MKALNQSRIPRTVLLPILRWVSLCVKEGARKNAFVLFTDGSDPHSTKHGVVTADAFPNGGWLAGVNERHLIEVHVPRDLFARQYPVRQQYLGGQEVEFKSWDEELAYTLAHEFRHLEQFGVGWIPSPDGNSPEDQTFEANAEWFALSTLAKYRKWRDRYLADKLAAFAPLAGPEENGPTPRLAPTQRRAARRLYIPKNSRHITAIYSLVSFGLLWAVDSLVDTFVPQGVLHETIERAGAALVVVGSGLIIYKTLKCVHAVTSPPWSYARRTESTDTEF